MRFRVTITKDAKAHTVTVGADSPTDAILRVYEQESSPEWLFPTPSGWPSILVEPVEA